ncbi:MAG: hypothetical protein IT569_06375 [Leptospiraceae bacterium]|nr:hypothetical protein [Leptospiraceae bacterium]
MQFKDYLKLQFKKPSLESSEEILESRKKAFQKSLQECYSRLESIELLYSNSKFQDSKILIQVLHNEITSVILHLYEKNKAQYGAQEAYALIKEPSISAICLKEHELINELLKTDNFGAEEVEGSLSAFQKIFDNFEKYFRKEKSSSFHTSLDDYKKRLLVQIAFATILLALTIFPAINNRVKYPPIKNDTALLSYTTTETENFTPQNSISLELNKEGWQDYKFKINPAKNLFKLRLDPISQSKIKIQLKEIRLLDNSGKVLKERDFLIGSDLRLKDMKEIENIQQMKPGKVVFGKYIEMISDGDDPQISFNFGPLQSVAEIQVTYRVAQGNKKFTD